MANKTLEIYFDDLALHAQQEVLTFYGMEDNSEGNFEISPLAILEYDPSEEWNHDNSTIKWFFSRL